MNKTLLEMSPEATRACLLTLVYGAIVPVPHAAAARDVRSSIGGTDYILHDA